VPQGSCTSLYGTVRHPWRVFPASAPLNHPTQRAINCCRVLFETLVSQPYNSRLTSQGLRVASTRFDHEAQQPGHAMNAAAGRAAQGSCTAAAPATAAPAASGSRVMTALCRAGCRPGPARAIALARTGRNELRHAQHAAAASTGRRRLRVAAWKPPATMEPEAEEESDYYTVLVSLGRSTWFAVR
jgi:hypothetical protein